MNWNIGQDIVAIKDHSQGAFKEGDVFTIKALRKSSCRCGHITIDVGAITDIPKSRCNHCGTVYACDTTWWFHENCFAPLDTLADISELTEHLETTKPFEV